MTNDNTPIKVRKVAPGWGAHAHCILTLDVYAG